MTYNGKNENWHLLLSHCRYFDKSFTEMFLEWSSTNHMNFVHISEIERSIRVAEQLALPTSVHGVMGSNPAGGEILPKPKRRFIAQSLSCSPFHRLEMTEILLKGRKTLLIHPSLKLIGCHSNRNAKFAKKYSKINSSEAIRGMKLKLCVEMFITLASTKILFFIAIARAFVAMATYNFHRFVMGKVKVDLYFCLTADILTKVFQKCPLSSPLPNIWILSKPLNLNGCHRNRNAKFAIKYSKINSSEAIRGMKLKLYRNVHNISLYKNFVFCVHCSCAFVAMATYNFHRLIMGKVGLYFYLTVDILTKVFQKCPFKHTNFVQTANLIGCHGNRTDKFTKKY